MNELPDICLVGLTPPDYTNYESVWVDPHSIEVIKWDGDVSVIWMSSGPLMVTETPEEIFGKITALMEMADA